jgi:hypothetical protein
MGTPPHPLIYALFTEFLNFDDRVETVGPQSLKYL